MIQKIKNQKIKIIKISPKIKRKAKIKVIKKRIKRQKAKIH